MQRLEALIPLLGKEVISRWNAWIEQGDTPKVVEELLSLHYDPAYSGSIGRNFEQFGDAKVCTVENYSSEEFVRAARGLIA